MREKPNLIYILADDMGFGDVSAFNENCGFQTPNLDGMCRRGISFTDAHASSAVCTPSRYSILTGRYNWRSRLKQSVLTGYSEHLIEDGTSTVADLFRKYGYRTACIGKWHLGMDFQKTRALENADSLPEAYPLEDGIDYSKEIKHSPVTKGFDYYFGIAGSLDMPPYVYIENNRFTEIPDRVAVDERRKQYADSPGKNKMGQWSDKDKSWFRPGAAGKHFQHEHVLDELTDRVLDKIEEYQDHSFFLYFPMPAPHGPILPGKEYLGKSGINEYADYVMQCDGEVGKILTQLKKLNLFERTIVIFTADNGCSPIVNYEELKEKGHNPSYLFRGTKADIFEGGHRIPYIVQWPEWIPKNRVCKETVCLTDLMATVADLLEDRLGDAEGVDSFSNLPLWKNPDSGPVRNFTIHQSIDGSLAIRQGRFKLEMCAGSGGWSRPVPGSCEESGLPRFQLYDLKEDVGETRNVIDQHPDIYRTLRKLLIDAVKNGRTTDGPVQKNDGEAVWNAVQWLEEN